LSGFNYKLLGIRVIDALAGRFFIFPARSSHNRNATTDKGNR
jgi:hypothetical protein